MLNRRSLCTSAAAALALRSLPALALTSAQDATPAKQNPGQQHPGADEMTINTSQQQQHFPPPDFGPVPPHLPPEALAVAGKNSLRAHAASHGLLFGNAVVVSTLANDPALCQLLADQSGILVPEVELKWVALRPALDRFDFQAADTLFAFAKKHHQQVRGHTLVWHNSVPAWLSKSDSSTDVRALLVNHIQTVVGRYRGRVQSWDVVNEAILPRDNQPGGLRKSFWYDRIGPDYIELAFRTAHEADPHAVLAYNDYAVEYDNDEDAERRRDILALVRSLQAKNVPIQAVGIQGHIRAAATSTIGSGLSDYVAALAAMKLQVFVTELDVNEDDVLADDLPARDAAVASTYANFLSTVLANPAVKLVLTWGMSDRRTWLNDGPTHHRKQPNRPQRSLPFDPQYRPTPAFFAIRDSFDKRSRQ